MPENNKPLRVGLVGCGHRTMIYASYALDYPDQMQVVAVADPRESRRNNAAKVHNVSAEFCFKSYADLAARPGVADVIMNGTMDELHYESSKALLEAGYDLLLEKPIARTPREILRLAELAVRKNRKVMICHVLRYTPFYRTIKDLLESGRIGRIISISSSECVSYHHMVVAYVRGKWNKRKESNPILLAKCCHDLDIIAWLVKDATPERVASFGSLSQFRPENAPKGSAERCLCGCQIESSCVHSAYRQYITKGYWGEYVWDGIEHLGDLTQENKLAYLRDSSPHGRCVWHCNNDVVDHQNVIVEFSSGVTVSHDLLCSTARPTRTIHIIGADGEIEGDFESGSIRIRKANIDEDRCYREEVIDVKISGGGGAGGHGGGDMKLVEDFVSIMGGKSHSLGATRIENSLDGHMMAFAAVKAMDDGAVVRIDDVMVIAGK